MVRSEDLVEMSKSLTENPDNDTKAEDDRARVSDEEKDENGSVVVETEPDVESAIDVDSGLVDTKKDEKGVLSSAIITDAVIRDGVEKVTKNEGNGKEQRVINGEEMEDSNDVFHVGDLVWGKIKRYHPWWPGQIYDSKDASALALKHSQEGCLLVAYFGDGSFSWCLPSQLVPFVDNFEHMSMNAKQSAVDEIGRLVEYNMLCKCMPSNKKAGIARPVVSNIGVKKGVPVPDVDIRRLCVPKYEPAKTHEKLMSYAKGVGVESLLEVMILKSWLSAFYCLKGGGYRMPEYCEPVLIEGSVKAWFGDSSVPIKVPTSSPFLEGDWLNSPAVKSQASSNDMACHTRKKKRVAEMMEKCENSAIKPKSQKGAKVKDENASFGGKRRKSDALPVVKLKAVDVGGQRVENEKKLNFQASDVNVQVNELLSGVGLAAVNPMCSSKKGSLDTVWAFVSALRSSTYLHGTDYNTYQKFGEGGKKRKSLKRQEDDFITCKAAKTEGETKPGKSKTKKSSEFSSAKSRVDKSQENDSTCLILKFSPGFTLPSKEKILELFGKFGILNEKETNVLTESYSVRIVYTTDSDAKAAFKSSIAKSPFGTANVFYRLQRSSDGSKKIIAICQSGGEFVTNEEKHRRAATQWENLITGVEQQFSTFDEFRHALDRYSFAHGFTYNYKKNDNCRATATCKMDGCPWRIYASRLAAITQPICINKMNAAHTCEGATVKAGYRATRGLIGSIIKEKLKVSPNCKPNDIASDVKRDYGIQLNYTQAWRAKEIAREQLQGSYKDAYCQLPFLCEKIMETNPGSLATFSTKEDSSFRRLFVSLHASISGFHQCRPLIFLDSTLLYSKYQGTLMAAMAADGNDEFFPVAFSVVDEETDENWYWFLSQLKPALSRSKQITFVSDFQKGIRESLKDIFGEECIYGGARCNHMTSNFGHQFYTGVSELPLTQMVDVLSGKIMELIYARRCESNQWVTRLTPFMEDKLNQEELKSSHLHVSCSDGSTFGVRCDSKMVGTVDIDRWDCSCKGWQLSGLPCCHAIAVLKYLGRSLYDYCSRFFMTDNYRLTYAESINPMPNVEKPEISEMQEATLVTPPPTKRPPGRPKLNLDESVDVIKRQIQCSQCKGLGHNKKTCNKVNGFEEP